MSIAKKIEQKIEEAIEKGDFEQAEKLMELLERAKKMEMKKDILELYEDKLEQSMMMSLISGMFRFR